MYICQVTGVYLSGNMSMKMIFKQVRYNTSAKASFKAPITTAADDKFCDIFPDFRK